MLFDLEKILQSKRDMRRKLAARPIEEKLALLDVLRERALALRGATEAGAPPEKTSARTKANE
jgi:hypothetical protein